MTARRPMIAALAGLALLSTAARAVDVLTLVPGSATKAPGNQIRGSVVAESPTEVKIKPAAGPEQSIPVDQVESITYEGQPASLGLAETRMNAGDFAGAIDQFKKAAAEAGSKPPIAQAAAFGALAAQADQAMGSPAKAAEVAGLLDAFIKANPASRHLGPALEAMARLDLVRGETDKADASAAALAKLPWAADRAAVLRAEVMGRKGQNDQAVAALDKILAGAEKGSPKARSAMLSKSKALAGLKKFDEAEALVRTVIEQSLAEDASVQAVARNTLGDCLRAAGRPKDALFAYLQTDILFDKDKEQHPRALYEIAQLWRVLKRDDRADETLERLKQQYPQSPYLTARPPGR